MPKIKFYWWNSQVSRKEVISLGCIVICEIMDEIPNIKQKVASNSALLRKVMIMVEGC